MALPAHSIPRDSSATATAPVPTNAASCRNCGSSVVRRYCAECGQAVPRPADYSLRAFAADLVEQLASVDGKVARTLWTLVRRPGVLTSEHLAGRRGRYLRPLQLFLLVNVVLFFAAPQVPLFSYSLSKYEQFAPPSPALVRSLVARAAPAGGSVAAAAYAREFDRRVDAERRSFILLFVPALALALRILLRRPVPDDGQDRVPRQYGQHIVFALHTLAFVWLVLVGWGGLVAALAGAALTGVLAFAFVGGLTLFLLTMPVYVFQAVRRVYGLSRARAFALTVVLTAMFVGLLTAYRALLFFTTYYTL